MVGAHDAFEILDLLVDVEPVTLRRRPVVRDEVVDRLARVGDHRSARLVGSLPSTGGVLDEDHVDALVVAVHREIQRLAEEFRHGARMAALLAPVVTALREIGIEPPIRVVDVGCASGYVVRWLAAHQASEALDLVGVDHHAALIDEARALARAEDLPCRFEVQDTFALDEPAHVLISTGILHHFRGRALDRFFASHELSGALAFVHVDFQPSVIAPIGAWLFHRTRMRLAISPRRRRGLGAPGPPVRGPHPRRHHECADVHRMALRAAGAGHAAALRPDDAGRRTRAGRAPPRRPVRGPVPPTRAGDVNAWLVAAVWALVTLDCALMGYRLAMGRSGLLDKRRIHQHASIHGGLLGQVPLAAVTALTAVLVATGPGDLGRAFDQAMTRLLTVAWPYTALVLVGTALCALPSVSVRSAASVTIFGPFTLLRPVAVVAAVGYAVLPDPRWQVVLVGLLVVVPGVVTEPCADQVIAQRLVEAAHRRGGVTHVNGV